MYDDYSFVAYAHRRRLNPRYVVDVGQPFVCHTMPFTIALEVIPDFDNNQQLIGYSYTW